MKTFLLLSTLLLVWTAVSAQALRTYCQTQSVDFSVSSQDIVLSPGTDGTNYCISTNKTWAQMNVTEPGDYFQNVLNIANQNVVTGYQVELEMAHATGIGLLSNFTVYLDNGTSLKQVEVVNGVVTQSMGSWCTLVCSSIICISVELQKNATGAGNACLKLHAIKDGTMSPLFVQTIIVNFS